MTKAEQRALAYAKTHSHLGYDYEQTFDAVKYGYLQAEKDLALTGEDVAFIVDTYFAVKDGEKGSEQIAEAALRRFNEWRNKK